MYRYPPNFKLKAVELRKKGYSLREISQKLGIAKSTASLWTKYVWLDDTAKKILEEKSKSRHKFLILANKARKKKHLKTKSDIRKNAEKLLAKKVFSKETRKLICAILYWAEGGKTTSTINFCNSDPRMIKTFITLFRETFSPKEAKFRAVVHLHEYHDETKILTFWSNITNIPLTQFHKPYFKSHTGKRKRNGYKGCIDIRYYDWKVAHEIKCIYNAYAQKF